MSNFAVADLVIISATDIEEPSDLAVSDIHSNHCQPHEAPRSERAARGRPCRRARPGLLRRRAGSPRRFDADRSTDLDPALEMQRTGVDDLTHAVSRLTVQASAERSVDLALNAFELIDRNLYERTCDVRWWATDAAVVACVAEPDPAAAAHAGATPRRHPLCLHRVPRPLAVRSARPRSSPSVGRTDIPDARGSSVANEPWFRDALTLPQRRRLRLRPRPPRAAPRRRAGRDLLREHPRRRPGRRRPARRAGDPFRLAAAGQRHRRRRPARGWPAGAHPRDASGRAPFG